MHLSIYKQINKPIHKHQKNNKNVYISIYIFIYEKKVTIEWVKI